MRFRSIGFFFGTLGGLLCANAAGAAPTTLAPTPTFACRAPHGAVAHTLCDSAEYKAMDREIAALTDRAKAQLSRGELSQLAESTARFVRQRSGCGWAAHNSAHPGAAIDECVRASLEGRVRRLRDVVARVGSEASR